MNALDEKLKDIFDANIIEGLDYPLIKEISINMHRLLLALRKCREQRDSYYEDEASLRSQIDDDELLAILNGDVGK